MSEGSGWGDWPPSFDLGAATVTEDEAQRVARHHAETTWAGPITLGPALQEFDTDGAPLLYAVPFVVGGGDFPPVSALLDWIAASHRERDMRVEGGHWATPELMNELEKEFGRFGTVYVAAQRGDGPVLMTTNSLPPFFFMADLAAEALTREGESSGDGAHNRLGRLVFANPHEEFVECLAGNRTLLLDSDSLQLTSADDLDAGHRDSRDVVSDGDVDAAWRAAVQMPDDPIAERAAETIVTVPSPRVIPAVQWTYWCAPTAWTMVLGYWDNFEPGHGSHRGYGKLVDYWYDHDPTMHNVPNLIDEVVAHIGDPTVIVNAQGYSFSKSTITCNRANFWGFADIKAEIDAGRPVVVGMRSQSQPDNGHAMVAYGYRISDRWPRRQYFLKVLNTWGPRWDGQDMEVAVGLWQSLRLTGMHGDRVIPGGGSGADHLILLSPRGGERLRRSIPYDIKWWVWGSVIQRARLMQSVDGGRTWRLIAANVPCQTGTNTYRWVPQVQTHRMRIRVEGFTSRHLVAGDGSRQNLLVAS